MFAWQEHFSVKRLMQRRIEYILAPNCRVWISYPLMLGGWNQPIIWTFLLKTGFQDILLMSYGAQKAYCAKRSSLGCYSMVHTLSPNVLMALNSHRNVSTFGFLGGRFNDSIRLCPHPSSLPTPVVPHTHSQESDTTAVSLKRETARGCKWPWMLRKQSRQCVRDDQNPPILGSVNIKV